MASQIFDPFEQRQQPIWEQIKRVHILGIGGSAMGAFAGMLQALGYEVRGSDAGIYPPMSTTLARLAIPATQGYAATNLDWEPDAAVVGNVIRRDNPEAVAMRERNLPHCSFPEALYALFMASRRRFAVAGTHGKTTTTSLLAWLLQAAGQPPGFLIGGIPRNFGVAFRVPPSDTFVVEADEYDTAYFDKRPKFVHYGPQIGVLTNIEFDHADIYRDLEHVRQAFASYVALFPPNGHLVACADDPLVLEAARHCAAPVTTYGLQNAQADWRAESVEPHAEGSRFRLFVHGEDWGFWESPLAGRHNAANALAALAAADLAGAGREALKEGLATFEGVVKRQQVRGEVGGVLVIDDYAHHPTAVRETVAAMRMRYPGRRLWALFEAESNTSRRRIFQQDYVEALAGADLAVLSKPLKKNDKLDESEQIDVARIASELNQRGVQAYHIAEFADLAAFVAGRAAAGDVVLGMSGRDFGGVHQMILDLLSSRA